MPRISTTKMTARQFLQMGEDPPGLRLELVDGEVAVSPSPMPGHSYSDSMLRHILLTHLESNDLGRIYGDVDTIVDDYDVRRPDIIYFANDRLHLIGKKAIEGPPDLCIEIVSPSSEKIDRKDKFKQYEKFKVANYWIVDPARKTVEGFKLIRGTYRPSGSGKNDDLISLPPFSELTIALAKLWEPRR